METFDICADLPSGTTLLEASAGTGKTWTIAALVTRYVAEGVARLDQLLVVTFTRAASQELRERVRAQLVEAHAVLTGQAAGSGNRLHAWLLDADPDELAVRRDRLTAALTDFDAATIATIHQFCQLVLRSLGVAGDTDADAVLVEDLEQLTHEVVDDLYLCEFADSETPLWSHADARQLGRDVVNDPQAAVEPVALLQEAPDSAGAARVRFAQSVLDEVERRKRRLGLLSYDDLLSQLADALVDDASPARSRMRRRWKVALIDEFQDTDPVQWQVFERAFHGHSTLVLIGDPKQAIYAFRGGDIVTYLQASEVAVTHQTLGVNWRADQPLLDSLHAVLAHARLGDERIEVLPVTAHHRGSRLTGAGPPFRLRVARRAELGDGPRAKPAPIGRWRAHVVADLAADVKRLLDSDARITDASTGEPEKVRPGHVAVLAARRADLVAIHDALAEVGVPSVVNVGGSVFHTPAAGVWLTLLEALEQPNRSDRVRAAALTPFVGMTAAELDAGGEELTDKLAERIRTLSDVLVRRGVAAVLESAVIDGLTERVLRTVSGERTLTDLRHIGEALHKVSVEQRLGPVGLLAWLREQVADDKREVAGERTRRLDSDAAAVQLVTIHGSKGLQYPIVYLPSLWDRWTGSDPGAALFHDDDGRRCRDVGGDSPHRRANLARHRAEDAGESLRLLYVALTRAQSQVVAWYAPSNNTPCSPLHRVLFGRQPGVPDVPEETPITPDDRIVEILGYWRDAGGPQPELAVPPEIDTTPIERPTPPLSVRDFTRRVDADWRRLSYTSLSAAAQKSHTTDGFAHAGSLSEPEDVDGLDVEETLDLPEGEELDAAAELLGADADTLELGSVVSPMATLPVGAGFGSLVHAVLEHADPEAPDLRAELVRHVEEQSVWWPVPDLDRDVLVDALVEVCRTPLGPLLDDATLLDITLRDRLRELDFEMPLTGGDAPAGDVRLGDLAPLLRAHLPEGDPVRRYADALDADPALADQALRGYLAGSIDVVLRREVGGRTRYLTVDYKTNWLGETGVPLTAHHYRPEALDEAMGHSDYPLQALLYVVVLHRFLRWRLPGYDPQTHLGGVLYLYLRGLCGPDTPRVDGQPCGVFAWEPPTALVRDLSDLLDGVPGGGHR
jgi:exodeoxyribonuclease V beta subunit